MHPACRPGRYICVDNRYIYIDRNKQKHGRLFTTSEVLQSKVELWFMWCLVNNQSACSGTVPLHATRGINHTTPQINPRRHKFQVKVRHVPVAHVFNVSTIIRNIFETRCIKIAVWLVFKTEYLAGLELLMLTFPFLAKNCTSATIIWHRRKARVKILHRIVILT